MRPIVLRQHGAWTFSGTAPQSFTLDFSSLGAWHEAHWRVRRIRALFPGGEKVAQNVTGYNAAVPERIATEAPLMVVTATGALFTTGGGAGPGGTARTYTTPSHNVTHAAHTNTINVRNVPWMDFKVQPSGGVVDVDADAFGPIVLTPEWPVIGAEDVPHLVMGPSWEGAMTIEPGDWTNPSSAPATAGRILVAIEAIPRELYDRCRPS